MLAIAGWGVVILIGLAILQFLVGYLAPASMKGKTYFVGALRKFGAPPALVNRLKDGYIDIIVAQAIDHAKTIKSLKMDHFHNALCQSLDRSAYLTVSLALKPGYANEGGGRLNESVEYQELEKRGLLPR